MSFKRFATRPLELFLILALSIMLVLVFLNVILRYFFHTGISISEEVSRFLFVWLTFLGAFLALRDNDHLGVDILTRHLSPGGQRVCRFLTLCLMLTCCVAFLVGSWRQVWINMPNEMPVTGMPLGLMYAAGVVSSLAMSVLLLLRIVRLLRPVRQENQP